MNFCSEDEGRLTTLGDAMLSDYDRTIASIPSESFCTSFRQAASNLDAQLLTIYRVAVLCAKELEDLDQVALKSRDLINIPP